MHNVSQKSYTEDWYEFKSYASTQDSEQNTLDGINKMMKVKYRSSGLVDLNILKRTTKRTSENFTFRVKRLN